MFLNDVTPDTLKYNEQGLIPAIIVDAPTKDVVMMAWMNATSLQQTLEIGETVFWSRSRQELWHKGATSGNTQRVHTIATDCDQDALLITVHQQGNGVACHTGEFSCFFNRLIADC